MKIKLICFLLVAICLSTVFTSCISDKKSDKELIYERLEAFLQAYNTGDFEGVLACFDERSRNQYQSLANLISGIGFGFDVGGLGVSGNLNFKDLFGFSVGAISDGDLMALDVLKHDIGELEAELYTRMTCAMEMGDFSNTTEDYVKFEFVKEDGDWYISGMEDFDEEDLE